VNVKYTVNEATDAG